MNRTPSPFRIWALFAALFALLVTGCSPDRSIDDIQEGLDRDEGTAEQTEVEVDAPPAADPGLTGRVGLIVATNSRSFQNLVGAPNAEGVAVLFVQPGGPSDGSGIEVGDVITSIDGEPSLNNERAVVQLRTEPGSTRTLTLQRRGGGNDEVTVEGQVPGEVDLRAMYEPLLAENPNDPIVRFLRAQTQAPYSELIEDTNAAIDAEPAFVEALSLKAELMWNHARRNSELSPEQVEELRDEALGLWNRALRIDPINTRVLVSRAQASAQLGQGASAKRDAEKARIEDSTFPGAHYAYSVSEFLLGRHVVAAKPARRAIDLNPYDVRYYELLARVFMETGHPQEAEATIEAIIGLVDDTATRDRMLKILEQD